MVNYRFLVWLLFLLSGLVMLHPVSGQAAEEGVPPLGRGSGGGPGDWSAQLSVGYLPSADLHTIPGDGRHCRLPHENRTECQAE